MTDLDSRGLTFTDMFGQKFARPGLASYHLLPAGSTFLGQDADQTEFVIEISPDKHPEELSRQQHVNVRLVDGRLLAEPPHVTISVGDVVTWHAPHNDTPPYVVEGVGPSGPFGSASMSEQAIYTHVFGVPGVYVWVDPHGSGLRGEVEVTDARPRTRAESNAWAKSIASAGLVHVKDGQVVAGQRVALPVGGTVCWAVESARAMAVTDVRLLKVRPELPEQQAEEVRAKEREAQIAAAR